MPISTRSSDEKYDLQPMVIDGMTSYSTARADQAVYRDFFHALVAYSKRRLMTTFFSNENRGGITLQPFYEKVAEALPLAGYTGILSRAPARLPSRPRPLAAAGTSDSR